MITNTRVSSLQLILAVIVGAGAYHFLIFVLKKYVPKFNKKHVSENEALHRRAAERVPEIKEICTRMFAQELRDDVKLRGTRTKIYKCESHEIYFIVHNNELYGVDNMGALLEEDVIQEMDKVDHCSTLKRKYPFVAKLV